MTTVLNLSLAIWGLLPEQVKAQSGQAGRPAGQVAGGLRYEVDPFWPKPLPNNWVFGELGSVCVDTQDHVFAVTRDNLYPKEKRNSKAAPAIIEFDPEGNVVNSWGNRDTLPDKPGGHGLHGCFVDYQGNFW